MSVSKRLRFEILRRDNHSCRYCGRSAPDVQLTVDHVVPTTLGGADLPENLVTACRDCNSGKSSMPADAAIIEDVASDALRWAQAMAIVAHGRAVDRMEAAERREAFLSKWNDWTYLYCGERRTVDLPANWAQSIEQFLNAGLEMDDLHELVDVAMGARTRDEWRYFCGCCWRRIKESHEHARAIIELQLAQEAEQQDG